MWGVNVDVITIEDCIDLCDKKGIGIEINDGRIVGFDSNGEV